MFAHTIVIDNYVSEYIKLFDFTFKRVSQYKMLPLLLKQYLE